MAVQRRSQDRELEELIVQAAAEVRRLNPHIAAPPQTIDEQTCQQLIDDAAALEALWNTLEGQRAQQLGYSAGDSISEDRGE